jgi:hypothetical protein
MRDYYINCKHLITNLKLTNQEFRIYQYLCSEYNVKKHAPFVRIVNIAGFFQISIATVKEILSRIAEIEQDKKKLLIINFTENYLTFEMPYYKSFLEDLGFKKNNLFGGFKKVADKIKQINLKPDNKIYLFPNLDQFNLSEALRDMPDEDFEKIKPDQLRFPWVYHDEKTRRTDTK